MRNYRLEARLSSRETDNRNQDDMAGYVATIVLPRRAPEGWTAPIWPQPYEETK